MQRLCPSSNRQEKAPVINRLFGDARFIPEASIPLTGKKGGSSEFLIIACPRQQYP